MNKIFFVILGLVLLTACASVKVERVPIDKAIDLSGNWNDIDSRLIARQMVGKCLTGNWVIEHTVKMNKPPAVIIGTITNRTDEHIDYSAFIDSLQAELIDSGKIKFVADKNARQEIRQERQDQAQNAAKDTIKSAGQETGADFMLQGSISSLKDQSTNKVSAYYQVTLEMINLANNEKVWIGQKEIKKLITRKSFGI